MRLKLENGMNYGVDRFGNRVCVGAKMGRVSTFPPMMDAPVKLNMEKLRLDGGGYDNGGAYWGNTPGRHVYCARCDWGEPKSVSVRIFVWASNRVDAKREIRTYLKNARFYR